MSVIRVLGMTGSLRRASTNRGLLQYARENCPPGLQMRIAELQDVPFYNADLQSKPPAVEQLLEDFAWAEALLLACPEYNYSLAPALKNALDWGSREPDNRLLKGKPAAIMGSGGGARTVRAQYHLRQVCVFLDIHPLNKPEIFCSAFSGSFAPDGRLVDEQVQERIDELLQQLQFWTRRLQGGVA